MINDMMYIFFTYITKKEWFTISISMKSVNCGIIITMYVTSQFLSYYYNKIIQVICNIFFL